MAVGAPSTTPMAASPPSLDEAYERCRAFTKSRASNFYYAFASLPKPKRRAIYAAYAFAGTVDDIADAAASPPEQQRGLTETHALLDAAYTGSGEGWLATALGDAVRRYAIPKQHFLDLIAGMEQDLRQSRYATFADLEQYCYRAASAIGLICIEIFGYAAAHRAEATAAAIDMGKALQLTNIMRDVKEDAERGRIYLAGEDLVRHGYSEADLLAGVYNEAFRSLMADYAGRARSFYTSGERLIPLLDGPRSRMCCNGLQGVYHSLLNTMEQRDYDVFSERVRRSTARRLLLLLRLWGTGAWPKRKPH